MGIDLIKYSTESIPKINIALNEDNFNNENNPKNKDDLKDEDYIKYRMNSKVKTT